MTKDAAVAEGPYFDELAVGQEFGGAPGITLTSGLAAAHQAITGDRLVLATDHELCRQVTGGAPLASPSLVWDVAIGQSTVVTQHAKANLFYRGLALRRAPRLGDTLRTSTQVVALRQNQPREGRAADGARGPADHHRRSGPAAGARLLALCHAAAARPGPADRARRRAGLGRPVGRHPGSGRAGQRLAAGLVRPAGRRPTAGRAAGRADLGGAGRRRGLRRAGTGPADPQRGDGAPRRAGRRRPSGSSTAATPSGSRWPRRPARCRPWSRWRPGTAATTWARCTRETRCAARSPSSRSTRSQTAAGWSTCARWSALRRPKETAGSAGPPTPSRRAGSAGPAGERGTAQEASTSMKGPRRERSWTGGTSPSSPEAVRVAGAPGNETRVSPR